MPPKPPHEKHGKHKPPVPPKPPHEMPGHEPPHLKHKKLNKEALFRALAIGTIFTIIVYGALNYVGITINIILPVIAPVWAGSTTLLYTHYKQ